MTFKFLTTALLGASLVALSACSGGSGSTEAKTEAPKKEAAVKAPVTLAEVIANPRRADNAARDQFRHPKETLEFFEVGPGKKVGEVWPGWYTPVIAPYLAENDGVYVAVLYQGDSERVAARNQRFIDTYVGKDGFGTIEIGKFGSEDAPIVENGDLDVLLSFRNVHNWMGRGYAEKAFKDFYAALKPGGILGIVEHRLPESATQDPKGSTGYVQESYMKDLAKQAGFEFVGSSEVNANPRDTADHPFGVWTLPPRSRVPEDASKIPEGFDAELFKNIGESDRATLKFRKPL
ncbi:methyltransferase [Hellea sp.]|nr:methyltransferase [Hellea sp.]